MQQGCWSRSANAYSVTRVGKIRSATGELRIASAMLRVLWRIRTNGNDANDDVAARFKPTRVRLLRRHGTLIAVCEHNATRFHRAFMAFSRYYQDVI